MEFFVQISLWSLLVIIGVMSGPLTIMGTTVQPKSYKPITDHCLRILETVSTASAFQCSALCEQTSDCSAIVWTEKTSPPSCVLMSDRIGNQTAASIDDTAPIYSSKLPSKRLTYDITVAIAGLDSDSKLDDVYCNNPSLHYKSFYSASSTYVVDFKVRFPFAVNVSIIELMHLDLGINQPAPTFAHWHSNDEIPYCQPVDSFVTGSVIRFSCPYTYNLTQLTYHVSYQGYLTFNSLKFLDANNNPVTV